MIYYEQNIFSDKLMNWSLGLVMTLLILSCSFVNMNIEPIAATITELSACQGVDETGKSQGNLEVFSPIAERIFVCGYLETVQPVDIEIYWYYEDKLVFQQTGKDMKGYFYSFVQPGKAGTFSEGTYKINVLIGGVVARSTEFRVEQPGK